METATPESQAETALAALDETEHEIVLDAAVSSVRDRPDSFLMYDDRVRPKAHVVARAQSYDPNVFFRWNLKLKRWEVWRWRGSPCEVPRRAVRPYDIGHRAVFCYVVRNQDRTFRPLGEYIRDWLFFGDPWRVFGSDDPKEAAKNADAKDVINEIKEDRQIGVSAEDWASDNKRQIAEFFGHGSPIFVMSGGDKS